LPDLRAFLVRTALDDAFRDLVERDPDAAFEGYDLADADKALLRKPGEGWMRLLGVLVRETAPEVHAPAAPAPEASALPEVRLLLALRPHQLDEERLGWAASLSAWPSEVEPDAVRFLVRVMPKAKPIEGGFELSYAASIQAPPAHGAEEPEMPTPIVPVERDLTAHADAVRAAPPGERYDRIRDLLAALGWP
jgi:hypothetical protein